MPDSGFRHACDHLLAALKTTVAGQIAVTDKPNCSIIGRFEQLGHLASMTSETMMRFTLRVIAGSILAIWSCVATAQPAPPPAPATQQQSFGPGELVDAGQRFFGGVSQGFAGVIEKAIGQWGLPNGYVLGEEAGGAFIGGLRYGEGMLCTKNAGDLKVFWQGPSVGYDFGGDGARTMMLVYNLPSTPAIYQRFAGLSGSAYFIGGFGMTALTANDVVLVPIRSGVGFRLGANLGYLKFTPQSTWNPF
jgi:hypothetical protein